VSLTPVANLPPVLLILAAICHISTTPSVAVPKFAAGVFDTVSAVPCASISHECYVICMYICHFSRLVPSESIVIGV
jgi:hypothetical protein